MGNCLDYGSNSLAALHFLAIALVGLGRDTEAIAAYKKAVAQTPRYAFGYFRLGWLQLNGDRPDLAVEPFKEAVRLQPALIEYQLGLATAYRRNGMQQEAEATLKKAEELRSGNSS